MQGIILCFPGQEQLEQLNRLLTHNGFRVTALCTSGAQVLGYTATMVSGIVVCGFRLMDMFCKELAGYLPEGIELLVIAPLARIQEFSDGHIVSLCSPIHPVDLFNTLQTMLYHLTPYRRDREQKPKARTRDQNESIRRAKMVLQERNKMSEHEAHRYIQKMSMDSGTNMAEMAEMILRLL